MPVESLTQPIDQPLRHSRYSSWWLKLFYTMSGIFVIVILAFNIFKPITVLPRVSLAPGFAFTNQDGGQKNSEDYRGKLTIYNFAYSSCADHCYQTMLHMQLLRDALMQSDNPDVEFALVTISIDPEHDTPAVLQDYATPFLTDQTNNISWDFLTGNPLTTKYVVGGGFNVFYENITDQAGQPSIKFEPRYVLVDGWGIIRAEYRGDDVDAQMLLQDIGYLTSEVRNSQGAARFAYEAAHLFRCYP